jgi:glycosyltransferase involved in cell wall biosynthesis
LSFTSIICGIKILKPTIFFEEEFLGVYPSLINTINLLCRSSSHTHIISTERKSNFPAPPPFPENAVFHKILQHSEYDRNQFNFDKQTTPSWNHNAKKTSLWKKFFPESLKVHYRLIRNLLIENIDHWQKQINWVCDKSRYYFFSIRKAWVIKPSVLIAIDESGLIAASVVRLLSPQKPRLVFWSLEIDTGKSTLLFKRLHEGLFSICARLVDIVVIQEKTRLNTLEQKLNYRFLHSQIFFIPHSPIGDDQSSFDSASKKNGFFQNLFSLSSTDKVILHAGWIHDAMCVDKIAKASKAWKPEFKLVLHEREKRTPEETFISYVSELSGGKALLSLNPVSFEHMDEVFSSAHIGLIAYDRRYGGGRENAHKASGKLGQYLKCGVPVVALDLPGYREMFHKYQCGMVFENFDEIENCIETILNDYENFKKEAIRCFREEFDFQKFFSPFLECLLDE